MKLQFRYLIFVSLLIMGTKVIAQADISMPTHWYNRANYNPATIARVDYLYLFSDVRQQWAGVKGAPITLNLQASEYFLDLKSAFGFSLVADKTGATQSFNPMLTYAYRINYNRYRFLSLGLSAGVFTRSVNGSLFEAETIVDPSINYNVEWTIRPDVNLGFEYQTPHFIYSISSTHLLSVGKPNSLFLIANHRYVSVIYKTTDPVLFNFNAGLQVVNRQNLVVIEGNACFRFKHQTGLISGPREIFELGLTLRTSRLLTALFGVNITPDLKVGYVYNQSFITGYYPNSTHEIMLEYRIEKKAAFTRQYHNRVYWYN